MMKRVGLVVLLLLEIFSAISCYLIGDLLGAWVWIGNMFIIAPAACIALGILIVTILIRLLRGKCIRWHLWYAAIIAIMAYPITIFFQCSVLTYPTREIEEKTVYITKPIEDGVYLGGKEYKTHAVWPSECYAYDILKEPYAINSGNLEDYGIYLADVVCPVNGTVIGMCNEEEDIPPHTENFNSSLGNYIVIEIEDINTYLILAHLEKDSITVTVGEHVFDGMKIAKVGNSGTTSEPHLHIQHQKDNPLKAKVPVCSVGLPIKFKE